MHPLHDLSVGDNAPDLINCIVEIPKGSRNKYELDKATGLFHLDRTLYSPMIYPGDYGLIPRTHYDDGDPLDVLIICNEPTFTGCIVEARPIAVFRMRDKDANDDKIVCVPEGNPFFREFRDVGNIPPHFLEEVAHFFSVYKDLEGHRVNPVGWGGAEEAREAIRHAVELYQHKFGKPETTTAEK
ncbi:MAG: inorganic diphosphatase [Sumerlaeia bacterium]